MSNPGDPSLTPDNQLMMLTHTGRTQLERRTRTGPGPTDWSSPILFETPNGREQHEEPTISADGLVVVYTVEVEGMPDENFGDLYVVRR